MIPDLGTPAHPTVNVLNTLYSKAIYPGNRDVFATSVKEENRIANKKTDDLKSPGRTHRYPRRNPAERPLAVHILSNADESDTVTAQLRPLHLLRHVGTLALASADGVGTVIAAFRGVYPTPSRE